MSYIADMIIYFDIFVSNNIILRRIDSLLEIWQWTYFAFSSFLKFYFVTEAKMQDSLLLSMAFTIGLTSRLTFILFLTNKISKLSMMTHA